MADSTTSSLPLLSAEKRRVAVGQFERANQVIAKGDLDYGIQLLLNCCRLDPGSFAYRNTLRQAEKSKYQNNLRGSPMVGVATFLTRRRMNGALRKKDYRKVLEHGEEVLLHNPWDVAANLAMAEAFDNLGLLDQAIWALNTAHQADAKNLAVNRALARLLEKRGNFNEAITLWEFVRKAEPTDIEAQHKAKDLAASATIARGQYDKAAAGGGSGAFPAVRVHSQDRAGAATASAQTSSHTTPTAQATPEERYAKEVATLLARIEADPTNANTYLHLAGLFRRADQLEQAREVLLTGLGPTGNNFDLALELADLDIEELRRNLAVCEDKLRRQPDNEEWPNLRQRLLREINARELEFFRRKADRYPTETVHRFEVGVRLLRAGQFDEAIRELQLVRSDPRHHGPALMYLGYCFKHRNNWRLAQRNFEEALLHLSADDPQRKEIMFQLAQGCAEAGDLGRAVEFGCDLANLDFSYRDIGRLLDDWQTRLHQA